MKKIVGLICLLFLTFFAAYKGGYLKANKNKNVLNLSLSSKVKSFDPAKAFDDDSLSLIGQSFDSLYQYHYLKRPYEVIPALAESLPMITQKGKRYTIKIKKNILYQHSQKTFKKKRYVIAQDFVTQIKRIAFKNTKSLGTWLFSGKIKGFDEFSLNAKNLDDFYSMSIEGIKAIDDHTLQIDLIRPEPNLLYFLSMTFVSPVPEELVRIHNNNLDQIIIGTGAYELKSFNEKEYHFEKFSDFRKELYPSSGDRYANKENLLNDSLKRIPFISKLRFHVIEKTGETWDAFMDGKLDIMSVPKNYIEFVSGNSAEFLALKEKREFDVKYFSMASSRWLGFNMKDKVWGTNKKLRQAISYAINYDEYINELTSNTSLRANALLNPSIPGYRPEDKLPYYYDVEKAKKLIRESGVKGKDLVIRYSTRGKQEVYQKEASLIKKYLNAIGVRVDVEFLSFSEFLKKGRAGELQFFTDNWIYDYPDSENLLQLLISKNAPGINKSGYKSGKIDDLYYQLAQTLEQQKRFSLLREIESQVHDELPWLMLMYDSSYVLHSKSVKNFRKSFFIRNYVKFIEKE